MLRQIYERVVFDRPIAVLAALLLVAALSASQLPRFRLDARGDSLTLENDPDRKVYSATRESFGSDDYIIVALAPSDPWSPKTVAKIDALTKDLEELTSVSDDGEELPGISRVISPTNQRLFFSLADGRPPATAVFASKTLTTEGIDLTKARDELSGNALYGDNIVSRDADAFALIAYLADDGGPADSSGPTEDTQRGNVDRTDARRAADRDERRLRRIVERVREISSAYSDEQTIVHASGIPTIIVDMVRAIERDMLVFGLLALGFIVVVLAFALRSVRWVVIPLMSVLIVVVSIIALTIVSGKKTTVVSSNLTSVLLIVSMAHAIHIAIHSREIRRRFPELGVRDTTRETIAAMARPCLYAALTTAVGFLSIAVSDIRPNVEFGLFMAAGALFAYVVSFTLIPAVMLLLPQERFSTAVADRRVNLLSAVARGLMARERLVLVVCLITVALSIVGITRLRVETRFTDYFRASSSISQGLRFIDERMGGTTPLEIVLRGDDSDYFLDQAHFEKVVEVHEFLDARPEIGTVQSLASLNQEGQKLLRVALPALGGEPVSLRTLVQMSETFLGEEELRRLVADYATDDFRTVRCVARVKESYPGLNRRQLLADLRAYLESGAELGETEFEVTGLFVLYTNMLHSLVGSQIQSVAAVVAALFAMLWLLLRNLRAALAALAANLVPIVFVLGLMGWLGIPLDMMTIMIASVTLGMAVDASIHYAFRFLAQLRTSETPEHAIIKSHGSTGRAISYTAFTVIGGFWVLALSNFKPTIYFGLLTSLAIFAALCCSLGLLPVLLHRYCR